MNNSVEPSALDLRLAPGRFYWSVIDAQDLPRNRRSGNHPGARAILEERCQVDLPVSIETLVITYTPVPADDSVLCCGLPSEVLTQLLAASPSLLRLGPESIPETLRDKAVGVDANDLNILVDEHEPLELARLRAKQRQLVLIAAIFAMLLISLGAYCRERETRQILGKLQRDTIASLGDAGIPASSNQLKSADFVTDINRIRSRLLATRGPLAAKALPPEAAITLEALLRAWPQNLETRTSRVSINEHSLSIAAEVPNQSGASVLGQALSTVPDWQLQPPQTTRSGGGGSGGATVQLSASLKRIVPRESMR